MESIKGCNKEVSLDRTEVCKTCKGSKCKPGTGPSTCSSCRGSGTSTIRRGPLLFQSICSHCGGAGQIIKNPCSSCNSTGVQTKLISEPINIPPGVDNGSVIRLSKKGHSLQKGASGDMLIKLKVLSHSYFRREGFDIHTDKDISFTQVYIIEGSIWWKH